MIEKKHPSSLHELFNNLIEGILILNNDGIVEYSNSNSHRVFACPPKDLIGKHIDSTFKQLSLVIEDKHALVFSLTDYIKKGKELINASVIYETTCETSGSLVISFFPLNMGGESKGNWILSFVDDSEVVRAKIHQTKFVKIIGHELKHPLSSLKAYLYMIKKKLSGVSEKTNEYVTKAEEQIDVLTAMLNDLTDITKISLQQFDVQPQLQLIQPVITQVLADFYTRYPEHEIEFVIDDPKLKMSIDLIRFQQVLSNILSNAVRYSDPHSTITVAVGKSEGGVKVTITDKGEGISSEDIDHVLDSYYRTRQGYQHKGLGLGLPIAKEIVRRHGGEITINSKRGKGTTVELNFPS